MSTTTNRGQELDSQLLALAEELRAFRFPWAVVYAGDFPPHPELRHHAQTAAWLAFVELGGDPDSPRTFAWASRRNELKRLAHRYYIAAVQGRPTHYGDVRLRSATRKRQGSLNDELAWDQWRAGAVEELQACLGSEEIPQDAVDLKISADGVLDELEGILSPFEMRLLRLVYIEDRSQVSVAQQLAAEEYEASDRRAFEKAKQRVNTALCRARQLAREGLPARYRELLLT